MELTQSKKSALIIGTESLVGNHLLILLLNSEVYTSVVSLVGQTTKVKNAKLTEKVVGIDGLATIGLISTINDVFICSKNWKLEPHTHSKKTIFQPKHFTKIAEFAQKNGATQCCILSTILADENSLFSKQRERKNIENEIERLNFWATHIFKPSFIVDKSNENRFGENLANRLRKNLDSLFSGLVSKYQPIEAEIVAQAMFQAAQGFKAGVQFYSSIQLQNLSKQFYRDQLPS